LDTLPQALTLNPQYPPRCKHYDARGYTDPLCFYQTYFVIEFHMDLTMTVNNEHVKG